MHIKKTGNIDHVKQAGGWGIKPIGGDLKEGARDFGGTEGKLIG